MFNIFTFYCIIIMMKKLIISLIHFYRKLPISSHSKCRYTPTCSVYMEDAINRFGVVKGFYLGIKRILRCNPLGSYGYDPVPSKEEK